jgi:plastocyanin
LANTDFDERDYDTNDDDTIMRYGRHESYIFYRKCDARRRNKFLFTADQNPGGANGAARRTRQNPNGNRRGLECPEERDYYPYWHPTPWVDIAIGVDDADTWPGCGFYSDHSQNVEGKYECVEKPPDGADPADDFTGKVPNWERGDNFNVDAYQYNNKEACEGNGYQWKKRQAWGIGAPDCHQNVWGRDNHLGNIAHRYGAFTANYNWTLPDGDKDHAPYMGDRCVLRIRYNISSTDYDGWNTDASSNGKENSPVTNDPYLTFAPEDYGDLEDYNGGYTPSEGTTYSMNLTLAIDTTQFSRTFQDRSHIFAIKQRPGDISQDTTIYNLNVRGKRGNIVQTYPATEYDFAPSQLTVQTGDYIHFQWTGCDTNPAGNDGEGRAQTDRSNIVMLAGNTAGTNYPASFDDGGHFFKNGATRYRAAHLEQGSYEGSPECATDETLQADGNRDQRDDNCNKLNAARAYFDLGLIRAEKHTSGKTYYYMSSRNNNFTNRSQKGQINTSSGPFLEEWVIALAGIVLGCLALGIVIPAGVFGPWIVTSFIGGAFSKIG